MSRSVVAPCVSAWNSWKRAKLVFAGTTNGKHCVAGEVTVLDVPVLGTDREDVDHPGRIGRGSCVAAGGDHQATALGQPRRCRGRGRGVA